MIPYQFYILVVFSILNINLINKKYNNNQLNRKQFLIIFTFQIVYFLVIGSNIFCKLYGNCILGSWTSLFYLGFLNLIMISDHLNIVKLKQFLNIITKKIDKLKNSKLNINKI